MRSDYLTVYNPMKAILLFSFPMMLGNLFQQLYTLADSAIAGRYAGENALAAIGASYSLTTVFICIAIGGGVGASVLVSRAFGAREFSRMKGIIWTALLLFLLISFLLGIIGYIFSPKIMSALRTPAEVIELAVIYLRIYFLGLPFLFMYNVLSSVFNSLGKSVIPLCFLIFSSVLNVFLDVYMVTVLDMGVAGVAWATLISQGISAVFSFLLLVNVLCRFKGPSASLFIPEEIPEMASIALPSILQQSTVSIGMMLVQSVINSFGAGTLAGFSAAMRVESVCCVPFSALGNAISSYTAQNIGAGKKDRVPVGLRSALSLIAGFSVLFFIILQTCNTRLVYLFLGDGASDEAIATGSAYMAFAGCFYFLLGSKMVVDGILRGAGDMTMFTVANLVNLGVRVVLAATLAPLFGKEFIWYAVPIGWALNLMISSFEYKSGKWRSL